MFDAPHSHVLSCLANHARQNPDKIALVEGDKRISRGQLIASIESAAAYLASAGLKPGDRIMLSARKELEFVYLYFAAQLLGIVNVVVDPSSPTDRLNYILEKTNPRAIIGLKIQHGDYRCFQFEDIRLNDGNRGECLAEYPTINPDDVADIMFTTGTTGTPKGVCLSHANLSGSASNINGFIGNCADDIEALGLPLSHSFGLGRLRCVMMAGGSMVLVGNFANLKAFFTVLENEKVTGFGMVPAVWQYIKRLSGTRIAKYSDQLHYIEIGSAALPIEDKRLLMELFPTSRICIHYGLTEASRAIFTELHVNADNLETIGKPVSSLVEVCILDEEGNPVANGIDGELCISGNMVMKTYLMPSDNADAFYGKWFRTGDWGHRDKAGNFYLTGRKKELINVGGEKVSPATIEAAIISLGVPDCACIAIPDPNGMLGEVPKAYLQHTDNTLSIEEIKQRLAQLLPSHEVPVEYEWVDAIPRSSSGKIQRLMLKK